ncbi:MAG: sigma-70 family RNA polymerase sigma factor [Mesorhizobium sp.]|nr:sigma-70 family RNA polymerase sigma factor [Mesorhizobium sp.]RWL84625.1 MAG: sigma-70 family RNA polymerase sigma factor [Mesorhizobium sp.]RWL88169.1 MAG: sigma-70 family RNA polymerase sigma factor [Mesorhizobium sp.]RWL94841.1 MAG: sigma-70 family RNA polymerase sigma factor [Mesorhizobium sp.]TIO99854.1 MAG: sigma-70 family RNA polymerase sigma factor [Mesorhizobium sp.]TIP38858.1 MAG: sigma-70 family RNA polymerase sigma factor [Mesorhizobium sp.]
MTNKTRKAQPNLRLVAGEGSSSAHPKVAHMRRTIPDVEWSILMTRAQEGDSQSYERLLREIAPYLRSYATRWYTPPADREDAVQDILLTLHAIRHTYDPARPFGPWLYAIANRRIVDRLRQSTRIKKRETQLPDGYEEWWENAEDGSEKDAIGLEKAITNLPPMQQTAIRLLKLKGLSLKEAAAATGISTVSLKVATHRAIASLRKAILKGDDSREN